MKAEKKHKEAGLHSSMQKEPRFGTLGFKLKAAR